MQEKNLFEYAIIRVVPRVEREEFLNVGVILYCPDKKFLQAKSFLNKERLSSFCPDLDIHELELRLLAIDQISKGVDEGGPIARLPAASRFRWLTSARSTIVQTSAVHPGLCDSPQATLNRIFEELVT